ncbi:deoxyribodipyrimidine photo-lyase, partial [Komagataeibacter sp. FXV2]|nr:deoxyribodipyrimidine photo-lyase [Komagataeibacter sp. FXV2]
AGGLRAAWQPGEARARERLHGFVHDGLAGYGDARDRPDLPATSRLSPDLRFGHVSPRQVWHEAVAAVRGGDGAGEQDLGKFLSELGWRDFAVSLLYAQPELVSGNFRTEFDAMPWRDDADDLRAWQQGRTGYPIVDAGMRQLWHTGWMHNRVRMIVASFLTKHLLMDWRVGEAWFRDTLVDADIASNVINWQWVAGCGVDAAPYFRVFNPVLQAQKFDPDGAYVRKWVSELAPLPTSCIHTPWTCDPAIRRRVAYPSPIVDLQGGRARALAAWKGLSGA